LGELGLEFGQANFEKSIEKIFMLYLQNTAAAVRKTGVDQSRKLAAAFKPEWSISSFIPMV
jgi:hypothetical protein